MDQTKVVICPYCGDTQPPGEQCRVCRGLFEPLSRQATHNAMGPWFIRDPERPFRPGCSYETLARLIDRGIVTKYSLIRGPTTRQFWTVARHVPGVAHLLGYCHSCDAHVDPDDLGCSSCGQPFGAYLDRNNLGLPDVRPMPWEVGGEEAAAGQDGPTVTPTAARARAGRGISSFAPDHELLAAERQSAIPAAATVPPRPILAGDSPTPPASSASTEHPLTTAPAAEDWINSPAVRSMQRRMARQHRTIRLLAIMVVVIAVAAAVFNIAIVASMEREGASDQAPAPAVEPQTDDGAPPAGESAARRQRAGPIAAEPRVEGDETGAEVAGGPDEPPPSGEETSSPAGAGFAAEYQRARVLIEQGQDGSRAPVDRLRAYEEALLILENIAENALAEEQPEDLAALIAAVKVAILALR